MNGILSYPSQSELVFCPIMKFSPAFCPPAFCLGFKNKLYVSHMIQIIEDLMYFLSHALAAVILETRHKRSKNPQSLRPKMFLRRRYNPSKEFTKFLLFG